MSFLNSNSMEIQSTKTIFISKKHEQPLIIYKNTEQMEFTECKLSETQFKYLGAIFSLSKQHRLCTSTIEEVKTILNVTLSKKLSIRNLVHIVNHVVVSLINFRLTGLNTCENSLEIINKYIRKCVRKNLKLPKGFPTNILYSPHFPVRVINLNDSFIEQEITEWYQYLTKCTLLVRIFEEHNKSCIKCHSLFAGPIYETKSSMINWLWKKFNSFLIELIQTLDISCLQRGRFTCQYIRT